MPKGGDLHSHLSGAVYAESFLAWAAGDGACVATATLTLEPPPGGGVRYLELMHTAGGLGVARIGAGVGWDADWSRMRQRILEAGLRDTLASARKATDRAGRTTHCTCGSSGFCGASIPTCP